MKELFKCTFYSFHDILPLYFRLATLVAKKCNFSYRYGIKGLTQRKGKKYTKFSFNSLQIRYYSNRDIAEILRFNGFQFLIGTVLPNLKIHWKNHTYTYEDLLEQFQFLIGTVLQKKDKTNWYVVSIPYRYGITSGNFGKHGRKSSFNSLQVRYYRNRRMFLILF